VIVATASSLDVVFFHLRGLRCALAASVVREMLPMPGLTPVPLAPPVLRGIAPLRGQILPVLDLGVYFPQASEAHGDGMPDPMTAEKIILIETAPDANTPAISAALAVERQVRVGRVDEQHSRPPPPRPLFLAATVLDGRPDQWSFGAIDLAVRRNAFGRQVASFEEDLELDGVAGGPMHAVFIRAPVVEDAGPDVEVLASVALGHGAGDESMRPVVCRQGSVIVAAFHPELAGDRRLHEMLLHHVELEGD